MFKCTSAIVLCLAFVACSFPEPSGFTLDPADSTHRLVSEETRDLYIYRLYEFRHPALRGESETRTVTQRVHVIIPTQFPFEDHQLAYFHFGNEQRSDVELLEQYTAVPRFIQAKAVYIVAEHRGYGESVSDRIDQSRPSYVTTDAAIEDAHVVIQALREEYGETWVSGGYGYGGALAMAHAARYPDDVDVVLSSSGPVKWPRTNPDFEAHIANHLSEQTYSKAAAYMRAIAPEASFDDSWIDREYMEQYWSGLAQSAKAQALVPWTDAVLDRPTVEVADYVRTLDSGISNELSTSRAMQTVTRDQALATDVSGRVFYYQQCTQLGGFPVSGDSRRSGVFLRAAADHQTECAALFGSNMLDLSAPGMAWEIDTSVFSDAGMPRLIYISGGNDPASEFGMPVPAGTPDEQEAAYDLYNTDYGAFINVPEGFHVPHLDDNLVHVIAWVKAFELAGFGG